MSGNDGDRPLFDPYLYRAMRGVARGEIRSSGGGQLTYRNSDVPARLADAVRELESRAYVSWAVSGCDDGSLVADLTMRGFQLFCAWTTLSGRYSVAA